MGRTGDSLIMNSPHEVGEEALLQEELLVGRTRPMEWGVMVTVVVVLHMVRICGGSDRRRQTGVK